MISQGHSFHDVMNEYSMAQISIFAEAAYKREARQHKANTICMTQALGVVVAGFGGKEAANSANAQYNTFLNSLEPKKKGDTEWIERFFTKLESAN